MSGPSDPFVSWGTSKGSYWNTINPFSVFYGGGDRIPEWWMSMFDPTSENSKLTAYLTFKSLACGLLAAGVVGGARALKHFARVSDMAEADNPAGKLKSQISTTFEVPLSAKNAPKDVTKTAAEQPADDGKWLDMPTFSLQNVLSAVAPIGATLLAASLAYAGVDAWASARRNRLIEKSVAAKSNTMRNLIKVRAKVPRGLATDKEVNSALDALKDDEMYIKEARQKGFFEQAGEVLDVTGHGAQRAAESLIPGVALLSSAVLLATAIGSYKYFSASDEDNIKYKVGKKSLSAFARNKASMSPLTIAPTDSEKFFDQLDGQKGSDKQKARTLPELDTTTTGKPISVTL